MQNLELIATNSPDLKLAKLTDGRKSPLGRYLFSAPETRHSINDPHVVGIEYTRGLQAAIERFFTCFKPYLPDGIADGNSNVLSFLRGGLNFGLRDALADAYGWNNHLSTYISSQRARDEEGRWYIKEDSYRKSTIAPGSYIFCGDVVATGVTLESGLHTLTELVEEAGASIKYLQFFTVGCHKAEKVLEDFYTLWQKKFPDFIGIDLVYIEGKFHLADSKTPVTIKLPGTDLLRRDSVLMPAFVESQTLKSCLERCTIYDAGARAFDISEHLEDVAEYWSQVKELADNGMTTAQYLEERYPEASDAIKEKALTTKLTSLVSDRYSLVSGMVRDVPLPSYTSVK